MRRGRAGGVNYMAAELFRLRAAWTSPSCPTAPPPLRQDVAAAGSDFTIDSPTLLMPLVRQGKLRALAYDGRRLDPVARPAGAAAGGRAGL